MPDKEFDNLFKDKFKDAEIEPSINLWANIEKELEPQRKRSFPIYWMAAATVALAFTAMLIFQEKEVIQLRGPEESAKVKSTPSVVDTIAMPIIEKAVSPVPVVAQKKEKVVIGSKLESLEAPKSNVTDDAQKNQVAMQPATQVERLPIKQQDAKPIDVLPSKAQVEERTVIAQAQVEKEGENTIDETTVSERRGIRNVGDLVNYVVEKVDKREKKLVRFNTDDDDNSSIVGINIGFLKFNKKNKDK